ncbi:hypothetical protein ACWF94_16840, partial [Streptomyces sp. NPDC055078]
MADPAEDLDPGVGDPAVVLGGDRRTATRCPYRPAGAPGWLRSRGEQLPELVRHPLPRRHGIG